MSVLITEGPFRGRLARVVQLPMDSNDECDYDSEEMRTDDDDAEEEDDDDEEELDGDEGEGELVWAEAATLRPVSSRALAHRRWRAVWAAALLALVLAALEAGLLLGSGAAVPRLAAHHGGAAAQCQRPKAVAAAVAAAAAAAGRPLPGIGGANANANANANAAAAAAAAAATAKNKSEVLASVMVWPREGGKGAIWRAVDWFRANGGYMSDKFRFHANDRFMQHAAVMPGEEVFRVPKNLVILGSMARRRITDGLLRGKGEFAPTYGASIERWIEGLGGDGNLHHLVAAFLLAEHASRGFFAPYVDGLPAKSVRYLPHQYNATELAWLGSGEHATIRHVVKWRQGRMRTVYASLCQAAPSFCANHSLADYTWAYSAVQSRAFGISGGGGGACGRDTASGNQNDLALVPLVDLANHHIEANFSAGTAQTSMQPVGSAKPNEVSFTFTATRVCGGDKAGGSEVFINYGYHEDNTDNFRLMSTYGFVFNESGRTFIEINLHTAKRGGGEGSNPQESNFQISKGKQGGGSLLKVLNFLAANAGGSGGVDDDDAEALGGLDAAAAKPKGLSPIAASLRNLRQLRKFMHERLAVYTQPVHADRREMEHIGRQLADPDAARAGGTRWWVRRACLVMRFWEKDLLIFTARVTDSLAALLEPAALRLYPQTQLGFVLDRPRATLYEVEYDDGDVESDVAPSFIQRLNPSTDRPQPAAQGGGGGSDEARISLAPGARVQARWRGGAQYFKGVIKAVRSSGDSFWVPAWLQEQQEQSADRRTAQVAGYFAEGAAGLFAAVSAERRRLRVRLGLGGANGDDKEGEREAMLAQVSAEEVRRRKQARATQAREDAARDARIGEAKAKAEAARRAALAAPAAAAAEVMAQATMHERLRLFYASRNPKQLAQGEDGAAEAGLAKILTVYSEARERELWQLLDERYPPAAGSGEEAMAAAFDRAGLGDSAVRRERREQAERRAAAARAAAEEEAAEVEAKRAAAAASRARREQEQEEVGGGGEKREEQEEEEQQEQEQLQSEAEAVAEAEAEAEAQQQALVQEEAAADARAKQVRRAQEQAEADAARAAQEAADAAAAEQLHEQAQAAVAGLDAPPLLPEDDGAAAEAEAEAATAPPPPPPPPTTEPSSEAPFPPHQVSPPPLWSLGRYRVVNDVVANGDLAVLGTNDRLSYGEWVTVEEVGADAEWAAAWRAQQQERFDAGAGAAALLPVGGLSSADVRLTGGGDELLPLPPARLRLRGHGGRGGEAWVRRVDTTADDGDGRDASGRASAYSTWATVLLPAPLALRLDAAVAARAGDPFSGAELQAAGHCRVVVRMALVRAGPTAGAAQLAALPWGAQLVVEDVREDEAGGTQFAVSSVRHAGEGALVALGRHTRSGAQAWVSAAAVGGGAPGGQQQVLMPEDDWQAALSWQDAAGEATPDQAQDWGLGADRVMSDADGGLAQAGTQQDQQQGGSEADLDIEAAVTEAAATEASASANGSDLYLTEAALNGMGLRVASMFEGQRARRVRRSQVNLSERWFETVAPPVAIWRVTDGRLNSGEWQGGTR